MAPLKMFETRFCTSSELVTLIGGMMPMLLFGPFWATFFFSVGHSFCLCRRKSGAKGEGKR